MKVKYFAWVRERVGKAEETLEPPPSVRTVDDLIAWLARRGEAYAHAFETPRVIRAAIDHAHVKPDTMIAGAREIAFFPPMTGGKYRVWAQALSFETAKGEVDLAANKAQDFSLKPMAEYFRQLPGDLVLAGLPEDKAPYGRVLTAKSPPGSVEFPGLYLSEGMLAHLRSRDVPILLGHRVTQVVQNSA